jgi:uncharacterized membrane protein YbjE (DUF340 family)
VKNSLIIVSFFTLGILAGIRLARAGHVPTADLSLYALYVLLFLIGLGLGADRRFRRLLTMVRPAILLVPLSVIAGTGLAALALSFLLRDLSLRELLAVGSGFGYYSLSSVIITRVQGPSLGVVALLANITREVVTLLCAPVLARYLGKLAPIAAGGATAMDTTLPVITRFSGKEYAVIAVFSGIVLTLLVPLFVTLLLK